MALLFDNAASQYLSRAAGVAAAVPLAMACWFYSDDATTAQALLYIGSGVSNNDGWMLLVNGSTAGDPVQARTNTVAASSSTGYTANTWHHAAGIFATATDRRAFIDGGSKGTNASNATPTPNNTFIGRRTSDLFMSGRIAEMGVWSLAGYPGATDVLKADAWEAAVLPALARGVPPGRFREGLLGYWPLWGIHSPEIDLATGVHSMVLNAGPVRANHPPVVPFSRRLWVPFPESAAAAGGSILRQMMQHAH